MWWIHGSLDSGSKWPQGRSSLNVGCLRENEVFCSRVFPYVDAMPKKMWSLFIIFYLAKAQLSPEPMIVHVVKVPTCLGDE